MPQFLRNDSWQETDSDTVVIEFTSDSSVQLSGFDLQIKCSIATTSRDGTLLMTNDKKKDPDTGVATPWERQLECDKSYETVSVRLLNQTALMERFTVKLLSIQQSIMSNNHP